MIPVLYEHNALTFNSFGIGALKDTTSCEVTEERNGTYELVLKYPISGSLYSEIQKERLIKVRVNDDNSLQVFRIYRISAPMSGIITVYAQHISYDLGSICVLPFTKENTTPAQLMVYALNRTLSAHHFSFVSDVVDQSDYSYNTPKSIRSIIGGDEMSILANLGGEIEWDNFVIRHHASRGSDNGITLLYGKNLTKLEHNSDLSDIYTHLCPYAIIKDGDTETTLTLTEGVLPIVTTLNEPKTLIHDFSSYFSGGDTALEPTEANLRQVAHDFLLDNIIGIEAPNITLSFEELRNQLGYQNLHEKISLCDTVTVKYPGLGVNAKTKVVKTVYDVLKEKYKSLTLGAIKSNLADHILSIEKDIDDTYKRVTAEVPDIVKKAVDNATELITGGKGGCVVIEQEASTGYPTEFLIMNTPDKQTASYVWRWNMGGLGFSSNGYNGPYTTAITADGSIVADFITTGTLNANIIKAGEISALVGDSYWNLETGDIKITGEINANSGVFDNVTINDSCDIYGYLWMEGSYETNYFGTKSTIDYLTRIGGAMNISKVTQTDRSDNSHDSWVYLTPTGMITIPDDYYTWANDGMIFGIMQNNTWRTQRLLSGVSFYFHSNHEDSNTEYGGEGCFKVCDKFIIDSYFDNYDSSQCITYWGNASFKNVLRGDWYPSEESSSYISTVSATSGSNVSFYGRFVGTWYHEGNLWMGTPTWPYQIGINESMMLFCYNDSSIGSIVTNTTYVNIRGTWRTNGNSWISSSDIKLKNTIEELDDKYSVLFSNLKPRSYKFNDGTSNRKHTGLIVQEVIEALKEADIPVEEYGLCCAFGDPNDEKTEWGLRYEELIALCINEIQKLNKRIKTLEEEKK